MSDTEPIVVRIKGGSLRRMQSASQTSRSTCKEPFVQVLATFVFVKSGNKPEIYIEYPINLSSLVGPIYPEQFELLKDKIVDIVNNKEHGLFFHNDNRHIYTFDESQLQSGGLYARTKAMMVGKDRNRKVTASKLSAIFSADDFEKRVLTVSNVIYKENRKTRSKKKVIDYYSLDLCIVVLRDKISRVLLPETRAQQPSNVIFNDNCTAVSTITNSAKSLKRKISTSSFTFLAKKLTITIYAPIEVHERKNTVVTEVPKGKTNKVVSYDLDPFIFSPLDEEETDNISNMEGEEPDDSDRFIGVFTLSRFRKDVMLLAIRCFPEEYSVEKKSLGARCKLYCQKQYNSSSWTEISDTTVFHNILKEQMMRPSRVKNDSLSFRLSFGRAKNGMEFESLDEFTSYVDKDDGQALLFEQTKIATSPFIRRYGEARRNENFNKLHLIVEFLHAMFKLETCKLHYGFLQEHGSSFLRIICADISVNKDASVFNTAIQDPQNEMLDNGTIDKHLLHVYARSHKNGVVGGYMPETNKYPPTNEIMMVVPPTLKDWRKIQQQSCDYLNPLVIRAAQPPFSLGVNNPTTQQKSENRIVILKFQKESDISNDVSVMIDDELTKDSTIDAVMKEGDVWDELEINLDFVNLDKLKGVIKRENCCDFKMKYNKLRMMTVRKFMSIIHLHDDYSILFKDI